MSAHRLLNVTLTLVIAALAAVVGPSLDEPHESADQVAAAAKQQRDGDGLERLTRACQQRHGLHAELRWTATGQPVCARFSSGGEMVAAKASL